MCEPRYYSAADVPYVNSYWGGVSRSLAIGMQGVCSPDGGEAMWSLARKVLVSRRQQRLSQPGNKGWWDCCIARFTKRTTIVMETDEGRLVHCCSSPDLHEIVPTKPARHSPLRVLAQYGLARWLQSLMHCTCTFWCALLIDYKNLACTRVQFKDSSNRRLTGHV